MNSRRADNKKAADFSTESKLLGQPGPTEAPIPIFILVLSSSSSLRPLRSGAGTCASRAEAPLPYAVPSEELCLGTRTFGEGELLGVQAFAKAAPATTHAA